MAAKRTTKQNDTAVDADSLAQQSLKYAEDIARLYEDERTKRQELEIVNDKLRVEVAERRKTEAALRESEERFRAVFEAAQDCMYIKNRALSYILVNPAMENLFQMPASELIEKTDEELYGGEAGLHLREIDLRVLSGESIEEEYTRSVKGMARTFLETRVPLHTADGEIIGLCGVARDITDRKRIGQTPPVASLRYPSLAMRKTLEKALLAASRGSIVLLLGESGCGKDYLARFIHDHSDRARGPFFTINAASVSRELAESELFGYEPGAFTGARGRKRGLLELAEGGTLFLNEIGELSERLQAKLLTFLDTRTFTRVGGEKTVSVNARLITATNKDLESEVAEGRFRRDLFYRLNVLTIAIPPLRERREDIPVLVEYLVSELQKEIRLNAPVEMAPSAMDALMAYEWPGNVRELRNVVERALILSGGGKMTVAELGLSEPDQAWKFTAAFPEGRSLNDVTADLKRALVVEALHRTGGNRVAAAALLDISRNSLNHYIRALGIVE
ncbi:MAG: PAS domain S-box protein [Deltaproteobacteria bacterium]|nr:PAS domain S-box protein [Deltaproteobacteria bacterium]